MEIHQIRYFLALCKHRTFTAAARSCGVSQPLLTNAIKALEQELGGKLFDRNSLRTDLTALGSTIRPHLKQLMRSYAQAQVAALRWNGIYEGDAKRAADAKTPMPGQGATVHNVGRQQLDSQRN